MSAGERRLRANVYESRFARQQVERIIRVRILKLALRHQPTLCASNVAFEVGKPALLFGDNGSGKTSFLDALTGFRDAEVASLEFRYESGRTDKARVCSCASMFRIGMRRTWQHARLFDALSVAQHVVLTDAVDGNRLNVIFSSQARERELQEADRALLVRLGLENCLQRPARTLSLSEQKKAALFLAMRRGNGPLVLDEPLAGLDPDNAMHVIDILTAETKKRPLIIVEHERNAIRFASWNAEAWVIERCNVVKLNKISTSLPLHDPREAFRLVTDNASHTETLRLGDRASLMLYRFENKMRKAYPDRRVQFEFAFPDGKQRSMSITSATLALLVAPNGWGKSSLLRQAVGLKGRAPVAVRIMINGRTLSSAFQAHRAGVRLTTAGDAPFPDLTVSEYLDLQRAAEAGFLLNIDGSTRTVMLSGGERTTLSIMGALQSKHANIVLLDEPLFGTDRRRAMSILEAIQRFLAADPSICVVAMPGVVEDE